MTTASTSGRRRLEPASRTQAAIAVFAAALVVAAVGVSSHGKDRSAPPPASSATGTPAARAAKPVAVTAAELAALGSAEGRPVYWVGPRPATTYELTRSSDGAAAIRYLTAGARIGDRRAFITVRSRPLGDPYAATTAIADEQDAVSRALPAGGVAVYRAADPRSVYVAFPGVGSQIEVFSPSPAEALALATGSALQPVKQQLVVPNLTPGVPRAVTPAELRALSASLGRPIYWAGPREGITYELTQRGAQLFLRYLPAGAAVGTEEAEPTIGTYVLDNAAALTAQVAGEPDSRRVDVGTDAVGFYRVSKPESVFFAVRGQDLQVEVYDPDPAAALRLATSGRVKPVR